MNKPMINKLLLVAMVQDEPFQAESKYLLYEQQTTITIINHIIFRLVNDGLVTAINTLQ
jgi:hypothetical protein